MAALPVAGSVTLALLIRAPPCDERAPFILIRPSGPRTTPGISGSRESIRSLLFGALIMAEWPMVVWSDDSAGEGASALAVTVTDSFSKAAWSSIDVSATAPAETVTELDPL